MRDMTIAHVLVVGGGFAGVAAAVRLRARGVDVTLLDDRAALGGRARSDTFCGQTIDTGAQLIASSFVRTVSLLRAGRTRSSALPAAAGAPDASPLHATAGRDVFVSGGQRFPLQFGSIRSLLAFGGLGAVEKLKLGRHLLPLLARHGAHLDAAAAELPPSLDRQSARVFVATRVGERTADVLIEPPLGAFYGIAGADASLAFLLTLGKYGSESTMLAATGGWSTALTGALRGAHHEGGVRVTALEAEARGIVARAEDGREWRADAAVVATGPRNARALLGSLAPNSALLRWLDTAELRRTWTMAVGVTGAAERSVFGIFQDPREARAVSACAVHGAKTGPQAATDRDVVLAWPTPAAATRLAGDSAETIVAAMMPEVERLVPDVRGRVSQVRIYRVDEGTPVARPGFAADRARARAGVERLPLPVALAGDYLTTPRVEGGVASGEWAADVLLAKAAAQR